MEMGCKSPLASFAAHAVVTRSPGSAAVETQDLAHRCRDCRLLAFMMGLAELQIPMLRPSKRGNDLEQTGCM